MQGLRVGGAQSCPVHTTIVLGFQVWQEPFPRPTSGLLSTAEPSTACPLLWIEASSREGMEKPEVARADGPLRTHPYRTGSCGRAQHCHFTNLL